MTLPTVTLVLVAYNSARHISKALHSIRAQTYPPAQVTTVVVDNASRDGTLEQIRAKYPWVYLLPEQRNHGFAKGNNIGMRRYPADYFALVNTDVELEPRWLETLIGAMEADPTIGVAGCKVFFSDRVTLQHCGAMIRPNALTYHLGAEEQDRGQYNTARDCDYVIGAATVLRGSLAAQLGYLPEAYFMYFEEADFCVQARRTGFRVRYVPEAVAYHDERRSLSGKPSARYLWRYHRSRFMFAMRQMHTAVERRTFAAAEREWLRTRATDPRYRALLLAAKLSHGTRLLRHRWLW